jgi:alpha-ketoglutarate-dependent taurine dioxygenase
VDISSLEVCDLEKIDGNYLLLNVQSLGGMALLDWAKANSESVQRLVAENGALLIRGLNIFSSKQFGEILEIFFGGGLLEYKYRSTPRTGLKGNVYTATEYPANEVIPQHNENSYSRSWPNRIGFLCMLPPKEGGRTPISKSNLIYRLLPDHIKRKFEDKGVQYVRNYSNLDLSWTEVFQTNDKREVEAYCIANQLEFEWLENDELRTVQVNPAVVEHPVTGEKLWFNQAHLFHITNLSEEMRTVLLDAYGEDRLPRNTYYGDGTPIPIEDLEVIRELYEQTKIGFDWQRNDLLLLDNMAYTHGREAYTGPRKILTGMACPNNC